MEKSKKCKKCGMSLDKKESKCSCEDLVCIFCCSCPPNCGCGCEKKK